MARIVVLTLSIFALALVFSCTKVETDPAITAVRDDHQKLEELVARAELSVQAFERLAAEVATAQDPDIYNAVLASTFGLARDDIRALFSRVEANLRVLERADNKSEALIELSRLDVFVEQMKQWMARLRVAADKLPKQKEKLEM